MENVRRGWGQAEVCRQKYTLGWGVENITLSLVGGCIIWGGNEGNACLLRRKNSDSDVSPGEIQDSGGKGGGKGGSM